MKQNDQIKDLFAKGLQDHQVSVDPSLWSSISSSIGTGAAKTGLSLISKTLIGVAASSIAAVSIYLATQSSSSPEAPKNPVQIKTPVLDQNTDSNSQQEGAAQQTTAPTPTAAAQNTTPAATAPEANNPTMSKAQTPAALPQLVSQHFEQNAPALSQSSQLSGFPVPTAATTTAVQSASAHNTQAYANAINAASQTLPSAHRVFLPNIFTPNGDGQNELLQIDWNEASVEDFSIVVLDAKNNVVFKDNKPEFAWDGSDIGGEKLPRGTYIYFVTALLNGKKWQQSSSLQIQY